MPASSENGSSGVHCEVCDKTLANAKTFRAHLLSKSHSRNASRNRETPNCVEHDLSRRTFEHYFADRLYGDLMAPHYEDAKVFDIRELVVWVGLENANLAALVGKIFNEKLEYTSEGIFEPRYFGLNQFKKLLIAARTRQSGDSLEFMKSLRAAHQESLRSKRYPIS